MSDYETVKNALHGLLVTRGDDCEAGVNCQAIQDGCAALAALERMRADVERLDWIGSRNIVICGSGTEGKIPRLWIVDQYEEDSDGYTADTLRAAIDAAMKRGSR